MTQKAKEIKKLAWKYFSQQKKKEIYDFFDDYWRVFCILMILSGILFQIGWVPLEAEGTIPSCIPLAIIGLFFIGFWVLVGLIALIKVIINWINSNWKEAKKKAKKELR